MISQFPALQTEDLYKVSVTDAAVNMRKPITESKEISDHLLNTCLTKAVEKSEGLNAIVKKCKELAQRTHQSSLEWEDIKKSCSSKYRTSQDHPACGIKMEFQLHDAYVNPKTEGWLSGCS